MTVIKVSDPYSNRNDQIGTAADILKSSPQLRLIFKIIYSGIKQYKTREELHKISKLSLVRVSQLTGILHNHALIDKKTIKIGKELKQVYVKDRIHNEHKKRILAFAEDPTKLSKLPTKTSPKISGGSYILKVAKKKVRAKFISVDEVDSFIKVKKIKNYSLLSPIYEKEFKEGLRNILGMETDAKDWGGEKNDIFTSRLVLGGKRIPAAFALKGKGTNGVLFLNKLGHRGDQIPRLFSSPAQVFIVQYSGEIDESVLALMKQQAELKSIVEDRTIFYGLIDGQDSTRIRLAYPKLFKRS